MMPTPCDHCGTPMLRGDLRGYVNRHGDIEHVCWICYVHSMNPEYRPEHRRSDFLLNASLAGALMALAALVIATSGPSW